jgi:lysyl-tRNA synthetase class I
MNRAWPYVEAETIGPKPLSGTEFIFETGYGPSGLPHIGTFTEVLRTAMVMQAHRERFGGQYPQRLIVFSDDLDGMRRVPENVPNQELLNKYIGVSLTQVPDPFNCCESFAQHNNQMLREFLDRFGFDYEFRSAAQCYRERDEFQGMLRVFHLHYNTIADMIASTMGKDRAATYSPFMPIDPETGHVYQAEIIGHDVDGERIQYVSPRTGEKTWTSILHGNCKLQWKADWAMRWMAQEVDYEMAGKDLTDSVTLSSAICKALGWPPPKGFIYEMFLDKDGHKVSKSVGNGMTIDDWLRYLVKLVGTTRTDIIERYLESYGVSGAEELHAMIPLAVNYYCDHVATGLNQEFYIPTPEERSKLEGFAQGLMNADNSSEKQLQEFAFEYGKAVGYADKLRDWFKLIYQTVFGYPDGPRIGLFIAIYGRDEFVKLLHDRLNFRAERFISRSFEGVTITRDWRAIDSAPLDGTRVSLKPSFDGSDEAEGYWTDAYGGGWYAVGIGHLNNSWNPTHWAPKGKPLLEGRGERKLSAR